MIIPIGEKHVHSVSKIHLESWAPYEISVKLGLRYLEAFYSNVVNDFNSFGYIFIHENDIIAYAVGFNNYIKFGQNFKKQHLFSLLYYCFISILKIKLNIFDILNIIDDNQKLVFLEYPKYHLGALAINKKYMKTALGKKAAVECIRVVIEHLRNAGYPSCWGCCDERNISMQKILVNKFGFVNKGTHKQKGRDTVMFEKYFTTIDE